MIPYLLPIAAIIIGIIFYDIQERNANKAWYFWIIGVYLILLFGLRYRIGWDTMAYMKYYANFPTLSEFEQTNMPDYDFLQPGVKFLWAFTRTISPDFWVFQIIHCTFVTTVVMWFIQKHSKYLYTNLLLYALCYCMYYSTEIMRESIAICFFLMGYKYLVTKKFLRFYIFVGCAMLFHMSAALLLAYPIVILLNLKFNFRFVIVVSLVGVAGTFLSSQLMELATMLGGAYGEKLLIYSSDFLLGKMTANWLIGRVIQLAAVPIFLMIVFKFIYKLDVKFEPMICLYIIFGLSVFIFYEIAVRFANYPTPLYLLAMGDIIGKGITRLSRRKVISYMALGMILSCYLYGPLSLNKITNGITPYSWIIDPVKDPLREQYGD